MPRKLVTRPYGFVRWSCGCLGIAGLHADGLGSHELVLRCCDSEHDQGDYGLGWRDMGEKEEVALPSEEYESLRLTISELISDGYRYRDIRRALKLFTMP